MASATTAPRRTRSRAPSRRPSARPRTRAAGGIRWDRVARISLLVVLVAIVLSYIGPATNYLQSWKLARQTRGEVTQLRSDNAKLRARARLLQNPDQVELEARELGMARPGERVYVVRNLPKGR
jgi:cell division protein FtsB